MEVGHQFNRNIQDSRHPCYVYEIGNSVVVAVGNFYHSSSWNEGKTTRTGGLHGKTVHVLEECSESRRRVGVLELQSKIASLGNGMGYDSKGWINVNFKKKSLGAYL